MKNAQKTIRYSSSQSRMPVTVSSKISDASLSDSRADATVTTESSRDRNRMKLNWDHYVDSRLVDFHRR